MGAAPEAPPVRVREAAPADLPAVHELLTAADLPLDGLAAAAVVLVADAQGTVVGTVSLERHGAGPDTTFLLRSAAVEPAWRARGVGAALVVAALARVDLAGAPVALLTETAAAWFPRFGFVPVDRPALPPGARRLDGVAGSVPGVGPGDAPQTHRRLTRRPTATRDAGPGGGVLLRIEVSP